MSEPKPQRSGRASATRERLLAAAEELLSSHGSHGAGLNEVCARSGVAYGSLYHQFPHGKNELVAASVRRSGGAIGDLLDAVLDQMSLEEAVEAMFAHGVATLEGSDYERGCPVGTPAAGGGSEELREAAGEVFARWSKAIARAARNGGRSRRSADELGSVLVSLYEGAMLLARTERSTQPLRRAAAVASRLAAS